MKTDLSISVQVNIGLTQQLETVVNAILNSVTPKGFGRYQEPQVIAQTQAQEPEQTQTQTQTQAQEPEQEPEAEPAKVLTEEDIRKAMHQTRKRIEGEDYKEHTDSEAYQKYHKALTAQFKNIAAELGADKPSLLPAEQRASFISSCNELTVLEDGTIGVVVPF